MCKGLIVAQLAEWSLLTLEDLGLNLVIGILWSIENCVEKTKLKVGKNGALNTIFRFLIYLC